MYIFHLVLSIFEVIFFLVNDWEKMVSHFFIVYLSFKIFYWTVLFSPSLEKALLYKEGKIFIRYISYKYFLSHLPIFFFFKLLLGMTLAQKFNFYLIEFINIFFYGIWFSLIAEKGNYTPRSLRVHPVFLLGLEYFSLFVFKFFLSI